MSHFPPLHRFADLLAGSLTGKPFLYEEGGKLSLSFDISTVQSRMDPAQPDSLVLGYTRTMMGCLLFNPKPRRITMIGLGGGSLAKYCHRYLPDADISIIEISQEVIGFRNEFAIPADSARFHIHCGDGAEHITNSSAEIDILMVDGYDIDGQAKSLCTQRFYDDCFDALDAQGVMVVNMCGGDRQIGSYVSRIRHSFNDNTVVVQSEDCTNKIVFAMKGNGLRFSEKQLLAQARYLEKHHPISLQTTARMLTASLRNGYFLSRQKNHGYQISS
ncbi:spermine/spermidine synthase domain-containing protein [Pseudogulbenkiania subflava]|uniref:Spermidine synthase n=1 Tax=Pseudogulbenkiania subflava DSM 22618 TaxID=1123014 RepID=A0A1Y6BWJ1_9NEIS|nr:hypothetical protein [Pseudogulbenkiania subflava]SMF23463.1 spermidine synthase [Pseudogulbenkiania subflava DSM 22618]SMF32872.1 spermidine synthase [Pseudogulbenkiania subflava DSM 22618]SMF47846.1 spermidine synthase [Pseudogulbenkiania subflava DSM 22618]